MDLHKEKMIKALQSLSNARESLAENNLLKLAADLDFVQENIEEALHLLSTKDCKK